MRLPERLPRLPKRPVRTFFRGLFRLLWTAVQVALDLDKHDREDTRRRPAKDVPRGR